jgi:hypothetical protein
LKKSLFCLIIVFLMLEGFSLPPDSFVVLFPGTFRLSDTLVLLVFITFTVFFRHCSERISRSREATRLIVCGCVLTALVTSITAMIQFGQPFLDGLLFVRHNFNYLLFFVFLSLIDSEKDMRGLINLTCVMIAIIAVLAIIQSIFPSLPIFNFRSIGLNQYSSERNMRFGEFRLFFPNISFSALFYFLVLSELLFYDTIKKYGLKLFFIVLFAYIVLATLARGTVIAIALATIAAFLTCRKKALKIAGIILVLLLLTFQLLSVAVSEKGMALLEENKFTKILAYSLDTKEGSIKGRFFQNNMYFDNFLKAPIFGVGTIRFNENLSLSFFKYGIYYNNDLGYTKMLAEYGIIGITWLVWFFSYIYRRTKSVLQAPRNEPETGYARTVCIGVRLFFVYIALNMLTIPHFTEGDRIVPIIMAVVFLEIAHRAVYRSHSNTIPV